jgi:diguanylate cyclase (GGDEF)-like protein
VLVDVDRFKRINDSLGHAAGDAALVRVAAALREDRRGRDLVARWGGEEFLLLLPETSVERACDLAESLRGRIAADSSGVDSPRVTVSMGVSGLAPGESIDAALAIADKALYRAKEGGRDRVESGGGTGAV